MGPGLRDRCEKRLIGVDYILLDTPSHLLFTEIGSTNMQCILLGENNVKRKTSHYYVFDLSVRLCVRPYSWPRRRLFLTMLAVALLFRTLLNVANARFQCLKSIGNEVC